MTTEVVSEGPAVTAALAAHLAEQLVPGDLVVLEGDMGAGKTTFAQALCAGLGVAGPVTSPTFGIAHRHDGHLGPVVHLDLYRLGELGDLDRSIVDDELVHAAVAIVEWPAGAEGLAGRATWRVELEHVDPTTRGIRITHLSSERGDG